MTDYLAFAMTALDHPKPDENFLETIAYALVSIAEQLHDLTNLIGHPDHPDTLSGGVASVAGELQEIAGAVRGWEPGRIE